MGIASRIARNWSGVRLVPEDHLRLQTAQQDVLEVRQWDFVVEPQLDPRTKSASKTRPDSRRAVLTYIGRPNARGAPIRGHGIRVAE